MSSGSPHARNCRNPLRRKTFPDFRFSEVKTSEKQKSRSRKNRSQHFGFSEVLTSENRTQVIPQANQPRIFGYDRRLSAAAEPNLISAKRDRPGQIIFCLGRFHENRSQIETHFDTAANRHRRTLCGASVRAGDSPDACCETSSEDMHLEKGTTVQF